LICDANWISVLSIWDDPKVASVDSQIFLILGFVISNGSSGESRETLEAFAIWGSSWKAREGEADAMRGSQSCVFIVGGGYNAWPLPERRGVKEWGRGKMSPSRQTQPQAVAGLALLAAT
jgi:hypothetical protein